MSDINLADFMPFLIIIATIIIVILGFFGLFKAFYIKVPQGTALIVNDMSSQPKVHFTGALVYPVIYKKELMRISLLTLEVDRRGKDGLICKDNLRADITVAFYLRVNETTEDVLKVAKSIGVERASDHNAVNTLFSAKFSEALKTVGKQLELAKLFEDRQNFRDRIVDVIGKDLNGYALEDIAIDYLEQTPKNSLDPNNIFDAEGIRKITEITAIHNIETNQKERDQELAIQKKNVETREASLALERQQADAEARQKREIESIRAREAAETLKVKEEERLKAEQARIQTQQEIEICEENRLREVEVAQQNRSRAVTIEMEKVIRAQELEIVAREREVELQRIEKEKALEEERKNISNVIRERVAVEKTVAQEEERIKEVRMVSEADRQKQITIIQAQAEARGTQEKGLAEAKVLEEKLTAQARGEGQLGTAQAEIIRQRLKAEADGLTDKFTAMGNLSDTAREHEEFRMQLEKNFEQAMSAIAANKEIAKEQAEVLATALSKTNIDIVGGDGSFFNTFSKALTVGKAINGVADKSPLVKSAADKLLAGKGNNGTGEKEVDEKVAGEQKLDFNSLLQNPEVQSLVNMFSGSKKSQKKDNSEE
ncbi:putative membrane protein YqiK [Xenorhabdus cabanillasii]|uniref:Putative membrane protein YqiK n=1 Tax=Xenorhabdus cabanillasii TaxID=351673 RepID=A0A3D9U8N0_9GAMM|nr:flotillin family protein [Xenorhabdus cabanillasii]REF25557.1 putative membrane protein YqiK [Xenorhabdus cabanillasii]